MPASLATAEVQQALKAIKDVIYYDSAAADTVFNDLKWFTELHPLPRPRVYLSSSGDTTQAKEMGVVAYKTTLANGQEITVEMRHALYNPSSPVNLICTAKMLDDGIFWDQKKHTLFQETTGQVVTELERVGDVFIVRNAKPTEMGGRVARATSSAEAIMASINYRTMHRRLMHAGKAVVEAACKGAGIDLNNKDSDTFCEPCIMGKATDELGKSAPIQGSRPFHYVRIDVVTHLNPGHLGYKYSLHVIDVWSNYHWVKFARTKGEVFTRLTDWLTQMFNQTGSWVQILGVDGGSEFGQSTKEFQDSKLAVFADARGIAIWKTTPASPWQNGKIERAAGDIVKKTRTTIIAYAIPEVLWPFVMETAVTIVNLLPTKANPGIVSPHEMFSTAMGMPEEARKPYIRHLRTYFCHAYYYIKPNKRVDSDKFGPRAEKGRLIGYADVHGKIYWIWNPVTGTIVRASAVKFNEGNDYRKDDDMAIAEYEVVFNDTTVEEDESIMVSWRTASRQPTQKTVRFAALPNSTPSDAPAPGSEMASRDMPHSASSKAVENAGNARNAGNAGNAGNACTASPEARKATENASTAHLSPAGATVTNAHSGVGTRIEPQVRTPNQPPWLPTPQAPRKAPQPLDRSAPMQAPQPLELPPARQVMQQPESPKASTPGNSVWYRWRSPPPSPGSPSEYSQRMPDPNWSLNFNDEEMAEIHAEAPIPRDHALAPYTVHSKQMDKAVAPSDDQAMGGRPRRQRKSRFGDPSEPGYYAKLNDGTLPGQNFFTGYLDDQRLVEAVAFATTPARVEHDIKIMEQPQIPKNYRDARKRDDYAERWLPAMQKQDESLQEKDVYDLVKQRKGMHVLPSKWVFDEKMDPGSGNITTRARWVVCGNFDEGSWKAQDVYAAVVNSVTVKTFFALTAIKNLECAQFDFKTAFLNANIPEDAEYYVASPPGLEKPRGMVCKLKKALYGLRQSPLYWFMAIKPVMEGLGFDSLPSDLCLFRHRENGALVVLYVDDLLVSATSMAIITKIRDGLKAKYDIKELGEVKRFLGFDVMRDRQTRKIFLSQETYTTAMLRKYGMDDANEAKTPWRSKFELPRTWTPMLEKKNWYSTRTGALNWVSTGTRPDIAYTASRLSEANAGPSQEHIDLLHHLFRYLNGTRAYGIELGGDMTIEDMKMRAFADASWADDQLRRHSTAGHVIFVAGGPVLWKTKKQSFVALSTTEAEFTNLTPTAYSMQWVAKILEDCGAPQPTPHMVFTDSKNAYLNVMNPLNVARTRCIDIRYKWIIEKCQEGKFVLDHIMGDNMVADGLTKPLDREKHNRFVRMLGMVEKKVPWVN